MFNKTLHLTPDFGFCREFLPNPFETETFSILESAEWTIRESAPL